MSGVLLLELRKKNLTPIRQRIADYSEDDLFDIIEFLYEHCSKPLDGQYHDFSGCGWHYATFQRDPGRLEYRERINKLLALYQQFPACGFRPENTLVLISHFANSLRTMLSRIPYLTTWANGVARHGTCFR